MFTAIMVLGWLGMATLFIATIGIIGIKISSDAKKIRFESVTNRHGYRKIRVQTPWGFMYGESPTDGYEGPGGHDALHYRWFHSGGGDWKYRRANWYKSSVINLAMRQEKPYLVP